MIADSYLAKPSLSGSRTPGVVASSQICELGFASLLVQLSGFKELMTQEGLDVDTLRMRHDSAYAFEQLALAHTSNTESLRHSAMRIFALFHK